MYVISDYSSLFAYACCRCIDGDGNLQVKFLQVMPLKDGKAVTIKDAITGYLGEKNLSLQKVAGFGSDGAACMIGEFVVSTLDLIHPAFPYPS